MKTSELNEKTVSELVALLNDLTREQVNLKVQKAVGQLTAPHGLKLVRRNIARVKTLLTALKNNDKIADINEVA